MSRITDDLRFMNPLEIVLNYDGLGKMDETINELFKLSLMEQYKFISQCEEILSDINNSFNKFMEMYKNNL